MKTYNNHCKIVQDLLPTYVVSLTSEETNQYIEEHIKGCDECKRKLYNMQEELKIEKIDKNDEIKGLKKVKRRLRFQILSSILLVIVIFIIGIYFNNNYTIYKDNNGKISIKQSNPKIVVSNSKYLIIKTKHQRSGTKDGNVYVTHIITINENNKCTNMRYMEDGYTENELKDLYNNFMYNVDQNVFTNIEINDNKFYYNCNIYNGKDKNMIIEDFTNYKERYI